VVGGRVVGGGGFVGGGGQAVPLPSPGYVGGGGQAVPLPSPGYGGGGGGAVVGGVVGGGGRVVGGAIKGPNGGGAGACGVNCGPDFGVSCGDGCGAGAGGGAGCCAAGCGGGYDETGVLSFVGNGNGDYRAETIYKYVGAGAGEMEMVMVPTKIGSNWCYCVIIVPLILLLLWLLLPLMSSDTTTTTPIVIIPTPPILNDETTTPPPAPKKSCDIYGDPHAMTFDGLHSDYYTSGEFWLVKSTTVWVQGKYSPTHATNGLAVTKQVGVAGSFLHGHKLIIGEEHATWDGTPILTTFPSQFQDPQGLVNIVYNNVGQLLQPGREGKSLHVVHVSLPGGMTMQINRWNEAGEGRYINTKITMSQQPQQDGQCGNFNGNPADDARLLVKARLGMGGVPAQDLIFPGPKTPINQELESCPDATLVSAHEACKAVTHSFWPHMECLVTVCNGGQAVAA